MRTQGLRDLQSNHHIAFEEQSQVFLVFSLMIFPCKEMTYIKIIYM
jgi:hypothetical protein